MHQPQTIKTILLKEEDAGQNSLEHQILLEEHKAEGKKYCATQQNAFFYLLKSRFLLMLKCTISTNVHRPSQWLQLDAAQLGLLAQTIKNIKGGAPTRTGH